MIKIYFIQKKIQDVEYIDNPNYISMYINKNFHFISTHQYSIETKIKWITNYNVNTAASYIFAIGKFGLSADALGYRVYWHNSNKIYTHTDNSYAIGNQYVLKGNDTDIITINDTISGLTNEFYLTLWTNIRNYYPCISNTKIYYIKITDLTTNKIICYLKPKYNAKDKIYFMEDITDNSKYYFISIVNQNGTPRYMDESELTKYENESEA